MRCRRDGIEGLDPEKIDLGENGASSTEFTLRSKGLLSKIVPTFNLAVRHLRTHVRSRRTDRTISKFLESKMRYHTLRIPQFALASAVLALVDPAHGQEVIREWIAPQSVANFGTAVCAGGDLDADGVRDLVITSWSTAPSRGIYAYSGATNSLLWYVPAAAYSDAFGVTLAHAGDIDQDGKDDILVGAPKQNNGSSYGAVHVLSGADGSSVRTVTGPGNSGLFGAEFGSALAGGADIDGDSIPDFAVGAPGTNGTLARVGAAYVYSGATGNLLRQYFGSLKDQARGSAVAFLEVDGDLRADLAISSLQVTTAPVTGAVDVFSGVGDALLVTIVSPTSTKWFGRALCALDDLNGDGADDLAIGTPYHAQAALGTANIYIASGASGAILSSFGNSQTQLGAILGGGDDLDGDGFDDVIAGDPLVTVDGVVNCGRAYAISGASGQAIWSFTDSTSGGGIGSAVATTGDFSGDGRAEAIVSAPQETVAFLTTGRVRMLSTVDCGAVVHYGSACNDDPFFTPSIDLVGCPRSNATITLRIETGITTTGMLVLGTQPASLPLPSGCTLYVGAPWLVIGPFSITGFGESYDLTGTLPPVASPVSFYAQAIVRKGLQSGAIDASSGLAVTVEP